MVEGRLPYSLKMVRPAKTTKSQGRAFAQQERVVSRCYGTCRVDESPIPYDGGH